MRVLIFIFLFFGANAWGCLDLPNRVLLKGKRESFTYKYDFALRCGKIYEKRRGQEGGWRLFKGTGIVEQAPHIEIMEISADGENLIAIDRDNIIYYTKIYSLDKKRQNWRLKWGFPKRTTVLPPYRDFAISHRAIPYEDIRGNQIPTGTGVTTAFILSEDGHHLIYGDPFLPGFRQHIALPLEGRFQAEHMAASGSTLFVIDRWGRMFTRLIDFDIQGNNPADRLAYILGYNPCVEKDKRLPFNATMNGWIRALPSPGWIEHDRPEDSSCRLTSRITIKQEHHARNGSFNNARQLRIGAECEVDGLSLVGYFEKNIDDKKWKFVAQEELDFNDWDYLENQKEAYLDEVETYDYHGEFHLGFKKVEVNLFDFNPELEKAKISFSYDGEQLEGVLYYREGFLGNKSLDNSRFKAVFAWERKEVSKKMEHLLGLLVRKDGKIKNLKMKFKRNRVYLRLGLFRNVVLF